jgi:glyoxylase-like metal-dependent hydrolase (beta-lactamase superfamily II)
MEDGKILHLIEPPCGSNTCIIESPEGLLVVDGGMCCYKNEDIAAIKTLIPDFDDRDKTMILTHSDADHCGIADRFNKIYVSLKSYKDFENELAGKKCYRETSPLHKPYYQICKILSSYVPPELSRLSVLGDAGVPKRDFTYLCDLPIYGMTFEVYEGAGGHVPGELVLIERRERLVFTGDIFVNVKDLTPEQHSFNRIAPYLTTTVDSDPTLARSERASFKGLLDAGVWLLIGGHGAAMTITA